jgi:hypothetical protein
MKFEIRNSKFEKGEMLRPFRAWRFCRTNPGRRSFLALPWAGLVRAFGPLCFERFHRNRRFPDFGFRISNFEFFIP